MCHYLITEGQMNNIQTTEVKPKRVPFRCPVCNGFGTLKHGSKTCQACSGTGYVVIEQEKDGWNENKDNTH